MLVPNDFSDHSDDPTYDPSNHPASSASPGSPDDTILPDSSSAPAESSSVSPKTIGPYRLVRRLGEGGMGQVWLAEQTAPFQRLVALKLIRAGISDNVLLERFESERQTLARMNHPTIAKVYDAGTTPDGTPYFVMEYVPGVPVTLYCDQKHLSIAQRIDLFRKVCEGVQHAHQKAIIHRDLKPANILVTELDGKPTPHIIDFGIAKAISDRDPLATMFTRAGNFIGTPAYMSPEQADPDVRDVDTRSDVYSLAVILYELLTGALPFDPSEWRSEVMNEAFKRLREQDPPLPSILFRGKVTTQSENASQTALLRAVHPQELVGLLQGDLDWITMKGLERERARRYGTPGELAGDLQRYLQHEPVTARPASAVYRFQKYVRRHRLGVALSAAGIVLLIAFAVIQAVQIRRITAERDRTTRERDRANRIADFMTQMFKVSDPSEARGNTITAREILDKSSAEIETGLSRDPELQAHLMSTMGQVYVQLGLFPQGQAMLEKAVATAHRTERTPSRSTLHTMSILSFLLMREGEYAQAEQLLRETIEGNRRVIGPDNPDTVSTMRYLATTLESEGKFAEADKLQREALEMARKNLGPEHWETLLSMNVMANILDDEKHLTEAEQMYRETLAIQQRTLGADYPDTLTTASNLASTLQEEGRLEEAEKMERETLATRSRVLGPEHPDTLATKLNLGNTLDSEGRYAEAETEDLQTLAVQKKVLGPENPDTLLTQGNLAITLRKEGRYAEAEKLQREMLEVKRRVLGADNPETQKAEGDLASTLSSNGKFEEARKFYLAQIERASKSGSSSDLANTWYDFACGASLAGRIDEALDHLREAISHGFNDAAHMKTDEDLKALRGNPRFEQLLHDAETRAASSANGTPAH